MQSNGEYDTIGMLFAGRAASGRRQQGSACRRLIWSFSRQARQSTSFSPTILRGVYGWFYVHFTQPYDDTPQVYRHTGHCDYDTLTIRLLAYFSTPPLRSLF